MSARGTWGRRLARWLPLVAGVLLLAWLVSGWWRAPAPLVARVGELPATASVGEELSATARLRLPWLTRPGAATVTPGEGLQTLGQSWHWRGLGWGTWTWEWRVALQPIQPGPVGASQGTVPLLAPRGVANAAPATGSAPVPPEATPAAASDSPVSAPLPGTATAPVTLSVTWPGLTITPTLKPEQQDPELAGELSPPAPASRRWLVWGAGGVGLLVLALLVWALWRYLRRPRPVPPPPPPWELAEAALVALEARRPLAAEAFFVVLTDIVRQYLEARLLLPATEQTTPEFLLRINRPDSPLTAEQRTVLAAFLGAADLVKFARLEQSEDQMSEALRQARRLVQELRPASPGGAP